MHVVVVDNELQPKSKYLMQKFVTHYSFSVYYVHEPRRGILQACNAASELCQDLQPDSHSPLMAAD